MESIDWLGLCKKFCLLQSLDNAKIHRTRVSEHSASYKKFSLPYLTTQEWAGGWRKYTWRLLHAILTDLSKVCLCAQDALSGKSQHSLWHCYFYACMKCFQVPLTNLGPHCSSAQHQPACPTCSPLPLKPMGVRGATQHLASDTIVRPY